MKAAFRRSEFWRSVALPCLAAILALAVAITGGLLGGEAGDNGVNDLVEGLSSDSGVLLGRLGSLVPLGFAFVAGLVSAINPCGFAMLPAYLGIYLSEKEGAGGAAHPLRLLRRALLVGGVVTSGFIVLFGVAGAAIGLGAHSVLQGITPWFGVGVGVVLAVAGAWMLGGGKLYTGMAARLAARLGDPGQPSVRAYFLFGLSYGIASLSCTLPIFLIVVGGSLAVSDILTSFGQFLVYALGMGLVIISLTLGLALFKGAMAGLLRRAMPYVQPLGGMLMILAGSYIVFYWISLGALP